ncbi:MAG: hypothetical protein R3D29_11010 [Nitratireductor sp.]
MGILVVRADKPAVVTIITSSKPSSLPLLHASFSKERHSDEFFQQFFNERGFPGQVPGRRMPSTPPRHRSGGLGSGFVISAGMA